MKTLVGIALMFSTATAVASTGTRGGGNSVVCFDRKKIVEEILRDGHRPIRDQELSHITSIELLDLYELRLRRDENGMPFELVSPPAPAAPRNFAIELAKRPREIFGLYEQILGAIDGLLAEPMLSSPNGIQFVDDVRIDEDLIDRENCVISTMAKVSLDENGSTFLIDQRLFNHPKHSSLSKSALYLHEIVYLFTRLQLKTPTSDIARKIVGLLLRKRLSAAEFRNELDRLGLDPKDEQALSEANSSVISMIQRYGRELRGPTVTCMFNLLDVEQRDDFPKNWQRDPYLNQSCESARDQWVSELRSVFVETLKGKFIYGNDLGTYLSKDQRTKVAELIQDRLRSGAYLDGRPFYKPVTRREFIDLFQHSEWGIRVKNYWWKSAPEAYWEGTVYGVDYELFGKSLISVDDLDSIRDLNDIFI